MSCISFALGELVTIKGGGTPNKNIDAYWGGDIPWASVKDFKSRNINNTEDLITLDGVKNSATNIIPAGTIIIPTRMALGKVAITGCDMAINQDLKALFINDKNKLDLNYLARFLESKASYIEGEGKGATVKGITLDVLKGIEIPLPPLEEQKRIAAILDKADAIRQKRQQSIELADEFLRSVFLDMFGDPVTNPKGWEVVPVNECLTRKYILEIQDGNHGNDHPKVSDFLDEGVPFIAANVVRKGKILFDKCYYLDNSWLKKLRIGFAKPRDVLLSHKGTLGLTAVLDDSKEVYIFSPQTTYYRLNESKLIPEYLKAYFDSAWFQAKLEKEGKQSTRAYIGITRQKDLPVMLPPYEEQEKFVKVINKFNKLADKQYQKLHDINSLFDSLSQKAFSGQL